MRYLNESNIRPVADLLGEVVQEKDLNIGIYFSGDAMSFRRLGWSVGNVAAYVSDATKVGSRVAIMLPNCPQFVIAYLATLSAGRTVVPINCITIKERLEARQSVNEIMPTEKIVHQIMDSRPSLIFVADFLYPVLMKIKPNWPMTIVVVDVIDGIPAALRPAARLIAWKNNRRANISGIYETFTDIVEGNHKYPQVNFNPDDVAIIQYTGGTTGLQKGAVLTYRNILSNMWQMMEIISPFVKEGQEVMLGTLPFFHIYGLAVCINACLIGLKSPLVIIPTINPKDIVKRIKSHRITIFPSINRVFKDVAALNNKFDLAHMLASLRLCISGAGPIDESIVQDFQRFTKVKILRAYGLSEASPAVSVCLPGSIQPNNTRGSMIGTLVPGTKVKIIDFDDKEINDGGVGIIWVNGPQVMKGYWDNDSETAGALATIDDEIWLKTGDLGYVLNGQIFFAGRQKHMATINAENIYHCDVERYIQALDGIYGVALATIPDKKSGEAIAAVIAFKDDHPKDSGVTERIKTRLADIAVNRYHIPKEIIIVTPKEFDTLKNELGKVDEAHLSGFVARRLRIQMS